MRARRWPEFGRIRAHPTSRSHPADCSAKDSAPAQTAPPRPGSEPRQVEVAVPILPPEPKARSLQPRTQRQLAAGDESAAPEWRKCLMFGVNRYARVAIGCLAAHWADGKIRVRAQRAVPVNAARQASACRGSWSAPSATSWAVACSRWAWCFFGAAGGQRAAACTRGPVDFARRTASEARTPLRAALQAPNTGLGL